MITNSHFVLFFFTFPFLTMFLFLEVFPVNEIGKKNLKYTILHFLPKVKPGDIQHDTLWRGPVITGNLPT